jgi:hypothetical protein
MITNMLLGHGSEIKNEVSHTSANEKQTMNNFSSFG